MQPQGRWGRPRKALGEQLKKGRRGCELMLPVLGPSALAEFDEPKRSTFIMFGVLTIAVRIYHDRWGYGVYSGPIGTAVLVITVKWVRGAGH